MSRTFAGLVLSSLFVFAVGLRAQESTEAKTVSSFLGNPAPRLSVSSNEFSVAARGPDEWADLLRDFERGDDELVRILPERRVVLLRTTDALRQRLARLRADRRVAFAFPVHHIGADHSVDASRYLLTLDLVVAFDERLPTNERTGLLERAGAYSLRAIDGIPGAILARTLPGRDPLAVCEMLGASLGVRAAHPDWLRPLAPRTSTPADPLFGNQWHLSNTGQGNGLAGADIGALAAWNLSLGAGTTIAVIDTGVDSAHPDIQQTPSGFNPQVGAGVGEGQDISGHGTRVAGVAAATGGNGVQVAGVAWQSTIMPIRLLNGGGYGTPSEEASCFIHAADNGADVITNSWGPDGVPFPLPFIVEQSFIYAVTNGRGGSGCPIFWASGNGNEDMASDGYVSSAYTIAVGATTNHDLRASYSDFGAALDLMAPSSGGTRAINTTDLGGGTTLMFGGTSASAPQAAGVAALMLSANPGLDWTTVRAILRVTASPVQPALAAYDTAGHSTHYGYGRLDAAAAVTTAVSLAPVPPSLIIYTWGLGDINIEISGMPPFAPWALGFSSQLYAPVGTGPLFGVGTDALATLMQPAGTIPFRFWANADGTYYWGSLGMPPGLVFQAVAITLLADGSLSASNVIQMAY